MNAQPSTQPSSDSARESGDGPRPVRARTARHPGPGGRTRTKNCSSVAASVGRVQYVVVTHTTVVTAIVTSSTVFASIATPDFCATKNAIETMNELAIAAIWLQALMRNQNQRSR